MPGRRLRQLQLFPLRRLTPCAKGQHGKLVDGAPQFFTDADCVNVDRTCSVCGEVLETVSWQRSEWDRRCHP